MGPKGNIVKRKAAKAKAKAKARQKKKSKDYKDEYSDDEGHSREYSETDHRRPVHEDEEDEDDHDEEYEYDGEEEDEENVSLTAADIYKTLPDLLANNPRAHEYFNDLRDYILRAEKEFFKNNPGGTKKSPLDALYESLDKISLEDIETLKQHMPNVVEGLDEERDAPIMPDLETKAGINKSKEKARTDTTEQPASPDLSSDSDSEFDEDVEPPQTDNGELDVDALLQKYDVNIKKSEDDSSYLSMEMDNDEFVQLQTTHMTEKEIMTTRYKMGEALSRNQFEKSFQVLQQELDDYELRDVLSEFYYELVRLYSTQEDQRIDLTELLERCTFDQITDDFIKRYEISRRAKEDEKPSTSKDLEAIKDDDKTEDANANIEIGMYGWGCLLQAELHRRRVFREMLFWFKTKLAASRIDGTLAGVKYHSRNIKPQAIRK